MRTRLERLQWVKYDRLYLAPEDIVDIGHALRREFPRLMFWPIDADSFWELVGDRYDVRDGKIIDVKGNPALRAPKPPSEWKSKLTPDPAGLLRSLQSYVWIVPHGWEPEWGGTKIDGRPSIENPPELAFTITRSLFWSSRLGISNATPPRMISEAEHVEIKHGHFHGSFWPWEEEKGRFLKRCKAIIRRHTSTRYVQVKFDGRIRYVSEKETGRDERVGFRAIEWARTDPRHFLGEDLKPLDWQEPEIPKRIRFPQWRPE